MPKRNSAAQSSPPFDDNRRKQKKANILSFLDGSKVKSWDDVEKKFAELDKYGKISKENFGACIGLDESSKHFAHELFDVLSKRKNTESEKGITLSQLKQFWDELTNEDPEIRIEIFFDLCDLDDDNKISKEEIVTILKWTASANSLKSIENQIEYYASLIVEHLDPDGNGFIEKEHLKILVKELQNSEEAKVLQGQDDAEEKHWPDVWTSVKKTIEIVKQNKKQIWVLTAWLAINAGLFIWKFMEYKEKEAFDFELMRNCIGIAKGSAETLKFNMALTLFLVCRRSLTTLKSTFLSSIFPFDYHISFHMIVGIAITLATLIHMAMHLGCGFPILSKCPSNKLQAILGPSFESKQGLSYFDFILSVPGVTGILMFIIMAYTFILGIPCLRHSSRELRESCFHSIGFNAFWYAHHLLFLVYVLLILHGYFNSLATDWLNKTTWKYVAFPLFLYISEGIYTIVRKQIYEVKVQKAAVYNENDLVALHLTKPKGFKYESGSYLYVNCKDIAKCEWHPFSITSAPGDEYLSIHIRKAGDWTEKFIEKFDKACEGGEITYERGMRRQENKNESSAKYPKILIKGPYGGPTQDYKKYDILLLIGFGVGATPMISVLKDVLNNIKTNAEENSKHTNHASKVSKKVYFYWVTPTQESFKWFKGVMNDVARYDNGKEKVIEMHNHLTSVKREGDARSVFVTILQNVKSDFISGSRIRACYGRPDWEKVFLDLKTKHEGHKIGVFYCGPAAFTELPRLCRDFSDGSTKFHCHRENV